MGKGITPPIHFVNSNAYCRRDNPLVLSKEDPEVFFLNY